MERVKKTRNRIIVSCTECSRRKQKCNREWPCNRCLSRRAGHLCQFENSIPNSRKEGSSAKRQRQRREEKEPEKLSPVGPDDINEGSEQVLDHINSSVLGNIFLEGRLPVDTPEGSGSTRLDPRRSRTGVLKLFPSRKPVDFLIQHFLAQVNWLFEEIYPQTFLERYNSWWSQPDYHGEEDIQFGVLILRICVNSLEFLPHPKWPTDGVLDASIDVLESRCNAAACKLDSYQPRKSSLLRIQQLLLYIATLVNAGNAKDSYAILGEAMKEAHGINLFLEENWPPLSEFEKENHRKAFWNVYIWDRFYCTFLGRWPLIPELYFSVKFPSETPYTTSADPDAPTCFTDVIIGLKLSQSMQSFISAPGQKTERLNPRAVDAHAQKLKEIIDTLHPAFRMENPDTKWDSVVPTLPLKRAELHLIIYGVIEAMHKGFVGQLNPQAFQELRYSPEELKLATSHRATLISTCVKCIILIKDFLELLGGGAHRYFLISMAAIEMAATLGTCVISDNFILRHWSRGRAGGPCTNLDPVLRGECVEYFDEGLRLLDLLAKRSPLASKGWRIMRQLQLRIGNEEQENLSAMPSESFENRSGFGGDLISSSMSGYLDNFSAEFPNTGQDIMTAEWESISMGVDMSWFFDDSMFVNAGVGDLGVDFEIGLGEGYT